MNLIWTLFRYCDRAAAFDIITAVTVAQFIPLAVVRPVSTGNDQPNK